jgi:hypothetical protein
MSVNRMLGTVKYCEILKVNKMEVPNTIDKINIMYSTIVPPYPKYCGCLQPLLITIDFYLLLSFTFHPTVLYWRGSISLKSWHCCKKPTHLHLPSTVYLRWDILYPKPPYNKRQGHSYFQIMRICKNSYTPNNTI